jgi:hypothetical protein
MPPNEMASLFLKVTKIQNLAAVVRQCQKIVRQAVVRQSPGRFKAVIMQSADGHQAVVC